MMHFHSSGVLVLNRGTSQVNGTETTAGYREIISAQAGYKIIITDFWIENNDDDGTDIQIVTKTGTPTAVWPKTHLMPYGDCMINPIKDLQLIGDLGENIGIRIYNSGGTPDVSYYVRYFLQ